MSKNKQDTSFELPFGLNRLIPGSKEDGGSSPSSAQSLAEQLLNVEVTDLLTKSFWKKWLDKCRGTIQDIRRVLPANFFGTDAPITLGTLQQTFERAADAYETIQSGEYAPVIAGILGVSLGLDQDDFSEKKDDHDGKQTGSTQDNI